MEVWETPEYWARMGYIIGSDFQNVFEDPVNYYPFDEDPEAALERFWDLIKVIKLKWLIDKTFYNLFNFQNLKTCQVSYHLV